MKLISFLCKCKRVLDPPRKLTSDFFISFHHPFWSFVLFNFTYLIDNHGSHSRRHNEKQDRDRHRETSEKYEKRHERESEGEDLRSATSAMQNVSLSSNSQESNTTPEVPKPFSVFFSPECSKGFLVMKRMTKNTLSIINIVSLDCDLMCYQVNLMHVNLRVVNLPKSPPPNLFLFFFTKSLFQRTTFYLKCKGQSLRRGR